MVLRLTDRLAVPLRERNLILGAAGFAPVYGERPLAAPELSAARAAIDRILNGHQPHPALAVDRHWSLISANAAVAVLLRGAAGHLVEGDINVLRLSLHPDGLAGRILNLGEWRSHVLARLAHEAEISGDAGLADLLDELKSYPAFSPGQPARAPAAVGGGIAVPLVLSSDEGALTFISTTTVFGTAVDVTLSEVAIEAFFPADGETSKAMAKLLAR